ncbi:hypothetical protein SODG_005428 [Sodalis praecaptivus]
MSETIKGYLYAAASVLDIWPSTNYLELLEKIPIRMQSKAMFAVWQWI